MRYFAYGSNMDLAQMADRCPGARVLDGATLPGVRFILTSRGYGSIVPDAGSAVFGVLWDITAEDAASLDIYEGVPRGLYRRSQVALTTTGGKTTDALAYLAAHTDHGVPVAGYLEAIVAAARRHAFPADYIAQLETWLPPG